MEKQTIKQMLKGNACSCRVLMYDHLPSTNTTARELASSGAQDGTVIIAARQSAGRGRMQRSFYSPGGTGLYMSLIVRRELTAEDALRLTTMAAVATAQAIESMIDRSVGIKWVNDIYLDEKKVSGILTEGAIIPGTNRLLYAVVGIGVNITPPDGGFPKEIKHIAGAIWEQASDPMSLRDCLAADIINRWMALLGQNDHVAILEEYRKRSVVINRDVTVHRGDGLAYSARALMIDDYYRLIVRDENGDEQALDSGEISIKL
jgi:BirA family biotin operon repressor/biotin-[acetyl-CoA-carboxylase] ligase